MQSDIVDRGLFFSFFIHFSLGLSVIAVNKTQTQTQENTGDCQPIMEPTNHMQQIKQNGVKYE